jgi:hypothetical protein
LYLGFLTYWKNIASAQRKDMKEVQRKEKDKSVFIGFEGNGDGIYCLVDKYMRQPYLMKLNRTNKYMQIVYHLT